MKRKYNIVFTGGELKEVEGTLFQIMTMPKHSFGIRKEKDYVVDHINSGRSLGITAKTEKDAIKELTEVLNNPDKKRIILEAPDLKTTVEACIEFNKLRDEFENLTGLRLPMNPYYGLDIISLDRKIKTPDGTSMSKHIENTYGKRARELISDMLNIEPVHYGDSYGAISEWIKNNY